MQRYRLLIPLVFFACPAAFAQSGPDCRAIAATTVAELRAGYENWSEEAEQLARAAAGAACVKARQTGPSGGNVAAGGLNSTAVRARGNSAATGSPVAGTPVAGTPVADSASAPADSGSEDDDAKQKDKDEESWNPFSDLKFNEVSARPGKKPYERRREPTDKED